MSHQRTPIQCLETMPVLLTTGEVCDLLRVKRHTLRGLVLCGLFPRPIALNARLHRYQKGDVVAWFKDHEAKAAAPEEEVDDGDDYGRVRWRPGAAS